MSIVTKATNFPEKCSIRSLQQFFPLPTEHLFCYAATMADSPRASKQRQLDSTIAAIQRTHGPRSVRPAGDLVRYRHDTPHISTGFPQLDAITGCNGVPLGAVTLFTGPATSGKSTLAWKVLANAQRTQGAVALLDLRRTADPDYLHRCGVDLTRLLVVRPKREEESTPLLLDVVQSGRVRCIVVNGLLELTADRRLEGRFHAALPRLRQMARTANCAVVLLAEATQRWHRWLNLDNTATERQHAALQIELQRERWLYRQEELVGYAARAQVVRSLWRWGTPATTIAIEFNGTVKARDRW